MLGPAALSACAPDLRSIVRRLLERLRWWRLHAMLRRVRATGAAPTADSLLEGRLMFEEVGRKQGKPPGATITDDVANGVPVQWLDFSEGAPGPTVLYVHGGAYCMGSIVASRHSAATHLRAARARGLVVDYRLSPEDPHPSALEDLDAVWRWLLGHEAADNIVVLGESAGGGLTISALTRWRDAGMRLPAAAVTISAWADLGLTGASYTSNRERDLHLDARLLEVAADAHIGTTPVDDPHLSPIHADLRGLPPLLLAVGTEEVVWDDTMTLHRNAVDAGVDARLLIGEGQPHCWTGYADIHRPAREAVREIATFVRGRTELPR